MKEITISKRTNTRGDDGHKIISLRMRLEMIEQIEDIAIKTDRSRNEVVNMLLKAALEHVTIEE